MCVGGAQNLGREGGEDGVGEGCVGAAVVGGVGEVGEVDFVGKLDGDRDCWLPKGEGTVVDGVGGVSCEWDGEGGAQERGESHSSSSTVHL